MVRLAQNLLILGVGVNPNETVNISLTQIGGSSADLIGAAVTITDDDSGDTLLTATWNGNTITTEIEINTNYTVSVDTISGYLPCASHSYQAVQLARTITFQYRGNGVFIEDTNGLLYTSANWDSSKTANSVVVITSSSKVRLALTQINSNIQFCDAALPLRNYLTPINNEASAKADYNGKYNTERIIDCFIVNGKSTTSFAPGYCNSYKFPDGKTKGYMPALGQLCFLYSNKTNVDACLTACGGEAMDTIFHYWSSTNFTSDSTDYPWLLQSWSDGSVRNDGMSAGASRRVRAVSDYE